MKIVGHRGAKGLAPENTLKSLQKALEHNVDEIECDVRVTRDNVVVLHHNMRMTTASGGKYMVRQSKYQDLKQRNDDLTTLEEALTCVPYSMPLQIEAKMFEPIEPIIKILRAELASGRPASSLLIGSKSQKILRRVHAELPDITKVVIHPWSGVIATRRAKQVNTKRISMNRLFLWPGFVRLMSKSGWLLYAYTINNPKSAKKLSKQGLAGLFTDYPDNYR